MSKQCFARGRLNACRVLCEETCLGDGCSFFKTKEQFRADINNSEKNIKHLDITLQIYFREKYGSPTRFLSILKEVN